MAKANVGERPMSELPLDVREHLDMLLGKDPSELSHGDLSFLHGRRDYLSEGQKDKFGIGEEAPKDPNAPDEEDEVLLTKKEAIKELKKLEVEFDEKMSREELNELLKKSQNNQE